MQWKYLQNWWFLLGWFKWFTQFESVTLQNIIYSTWSQLNKYTLQCIYTPCPIVARRWWVDFFFLQFFLSIIKRLQFKIQGLVQRITNCIQIDQSHHSRFYLCLDCWIIHHFSCFNINHCHLYTLVEILGRFLENNKISVNFESLLIWKCLYCNNYINNIISYTFG